MHCKSCDCLLNDYETNRKDTDGNYIDLCADCYVTIASEVPSADDDDLLFIYDRDE